MPFELPHKDVSIAWDLISRKCLIWKSQLGGVDREEEEATFRNLSPNVLQALWSIQLQMEAYLPRRLCARCRTMACSRM
ncbi:unnamed protein product, partial [Choristocarpus tenellus]